MKKLFLIALTLAFSATLYAQGFDPDSSYIEFKVSNWMVNTVSGTIGGWEGQVSFDPQNPGGSSFDVSAKIRTIDTDNDERDESLRSSDFFDAEKHPEIHFKSIRVNKLPDDKLIAVGKLTIRGVTNEVLMPFSFKNGKLHGEITIDRLDYGVGEDHSSFSVGKEVSVTVVCDLK